MAQHVLHRLAFGRDVAIPERTALVAGRPATALAGRIFLAAIFILSGIMKFLNHAETVGYMEAQGIPSASALGYIAGLVEVLGGLSILTGFATRLGALALFLFLIPTTLMFHDFWAMSGAERTGQMVNFMKNLAVMGGLLVLVAHGPGRYSIDAKVRH
jgi:putative oxidoreductase